METQKVVEALLNQVDNIKHIKNALISCQVINEERNWIKMEHTEINSYISHFHKPVIICLINIIITCIIIEPKIEHRLYPVFIINGNESLFYNMSKTEIIKKSIQYSNIKDFLPEIYARHIFWIPFKNKDKKELSASSTKSDIELLSSIKDISILEEEKIDITIFTEYIKGNWTIDFNIANVIPKNNIKTKYVTILKNILCEI